MFKRQLGFTLIELIVVIVILGILAATALPKYMGIQTSARVSVIKGARGAVASAANIATAMQQSLGYSVGQAITLDGTLITMVNRYPAAASIYAAAGLSADYSAVVAASVATIQVVNAATPASCSFTYTEASASSAPAITTVVTTGC